MGIPSSVKASLYNPPCPLYVGKPESAEIPAPVIKRMLLDFLKRTTTCLIFSLF
jgi:hypothetical protein